jgi:transposase
MLDDCVGYEALLENQAIIELGCVAHARRKFFELHAASGFPIALEALNRIAALYAFEKFVAENNFSSMERGKLRQTQAQPLIDEMKTWLTNTRMIVANGSALAKAMDYGLGRWQRCRARPKTMSWRKAASCPLTTIQSKTRSVRLRWERRIGC